MVLGRSQYKVVPPELKPVIEEGRLLIVSVVSPSIQRQSVETAAHRNWFIIENADEVVFGAINEASSLYPLYQEALKMGKEVKLLK